MKKSWLLGFVVLLAACSPAEPEVLEQNPEPVTLEFFTVKEETKPIFDHLIAEFEKKYPYINVEQVIAPYGMSALKTRIAQGYPPDLFISYPLEQDYNNRALKGYMLDLTDEMFIDRIQPTIQQRYTVNGRMYGVAFTQNAVGVLYNKEDFSDLGLTVPSTWDKWISVMDALKQAGKQPLIMPNKEADQTSIVTLNFVANVFSPSYWKNIPSMVNDPRWKEINRKTEVLLSYTNAESFNMGYSEANESFAAEEGTMYIMGNWVLPVIEKLNPSLQYGIFPVPVSNDIEQNDILGGVDIGISISSETKYPVEAKLFLAFLTEEKNAQSLSVYEGSINTIMGVQKTKKILKPLEEKVIDGETVNWPNHYWAGGTTAETEYRQHTMQFFHDRNEQKYINNLEKMFEKYNKSMPIEKVNP